jgi:ABC-2 type transport system permease protein
VTFVLALLGGNFVGPGAAPELLRQLSLLTPNGWALAAFTDLSADAVSLASVLGAVSVLMAVAVVSGTIGLRRIHRLVAR